MCVYAYFLFCSINLALSMSYINDYSCVLHSESLTGSIIAGKPTIDQKTHGCTGYQSKFAMIAGFFLTFELVTVITETNPQGV